MASNNDAHVTATPAAPAIVVATAATAAAVVADGRSEWWSRARMFAAGGVAGIANLTVGHPLDTLKVRLQTEGRFGRFAGPIDCIRQTVRTEGVLGFYKGFTPPLLGRVMTHSVMFGLQGWTLRELAHRYSGDDGTHPRDELMRTAPLSHIFISGFVAGMGMIAVCTPIDQTKALLQVQYAEARKAAATGGMAGAPAAGAAAAETAASTTAAMRYSGPLDCGRQLVRQYGVYGGLFRWWFPSALELSTLSVYFTAYAVAYRAMRPLHNDGRAGQMPAGVAAALSGALGGGAMILASYPFDVIRSRLMAQPRVPGQPLRFTGWRDCATKIWRAEGPRAFVAGFVPGLGRSFAANAAGFSAYELALKLIPN